MVVDDVEDHLDARFVQLPDQHLELGDLTSRRLAGGVRRFGCEEADGVVAPVVRQSLLRQEIVDVVLVDGEQLHGVDSQFRQVGDLVDEPQICSGVPHTG
jgi:hypothetical protein